MDDCPKNCRVLLFVLGKNEWITGRYKKEKQLEHSKNKIPACFIDDALFVVKPVAWLPLPEVPEEYK